MTTIYKNLCIYFMLCGITLVSLHGQVSAKSTTLNRSIDPEIQRKIDEFIQFFYLPSSQISGLGLAIVQNDGEVLYTTGYGLADQEKGIPNGNSTQFLIGSVTKSFTATLLAKLLHENFPDLGEAVLDTPIRTLFPLTNFTLIDRFRSEHATFRDILAHRLCLGIEDLQLFGDPFDTPEEVTYRTRYHPEICGVRGLFIYHQQMYLVAAEYIAIMAGKPYEDALLELAHEIGMTNTTFLQKSDDFTQMPYRAMPYYIRGGETHPYNTELVKRFTLHNPAGGLFAPVDDMATYMQFQLNLGTVGRQQVVPKEVMEWLTKPSILVSGYGFKMAEEDLVLSGFAYGLGLLLGSYDGWSYIQHTGNVAPYFSLMSLFPDKNLGIFTTTHMGPVGMVQHVVHAFIFEALRGNVEPLEKVLKLKESIHSSEERRRNQARKEFDEFYQEIVGKSATGQNVEQVEIVGKYGSGPQGDAEVTERFNEATNQTQYYFQYGRWYTGWLQETPEGGGTTFQLVYDGDVIQDEYVAGYNGESSFLYFNNGTLMVFTAIEDQALVRAVFKLGENLNTLPPIPWNPDSC